MRPSVGALIVGAALAVQPGEAQAQTTKKPLTAVSEAEFGKVKAVIMDSILSDGYSPAHEATARSRGYETYHNPVTGAFYVYIESFDVVDRDSMTGTIFRSTKENPEDQTCFAALTYVDEFTEGGQRVLVLGRDDVIIEHILCPDLKPEAPAPVAKPEVLTDTDIPSVGTFKGLGEQVMKGALFLKPIAMGLEEAQVDTKLDRPGNILRRSSLGVDAYTKYETVKFDPSTGRLTLRLDNGKKTDECTVAITYTNSFIQDGQRYFVVTSDFKTDPKECSASTPEEEELATVTTSEPWHVKGYAHIGLNEEELGSDYTLGRAGMGAVAVQVRSPYAPICLGLNGDAIIAEAGAGFEGFMGSLGYCNDRLDVSFVGGVSGEPRAPETTLNGAPTLGLLAHYDVLQSGGWGINVGASARLDLYGGGAFPANVAVLVGATRDFEIGGTKKKPKDSVPTPKEPVDVPSPVEPSLVETIKPSDIRYKKVSYTLVDRETNPLSELDEGTRVRIFGDMKKAAERNAWPAVEKSFKMLLDLKGALTYDDYLMGVKAAHGLGNIKAEYERLLWAYDVKKTKEVGDRLKEIELSYAYVDILVKGDTSADLQVVQPPFGPIARDSLALVLADFGGDKHVTGFLPIMDDDGKTTLEYTLGGVPLKLEPLSMGQVAEKPKPGQKLVEEKPYYVSKSADRSKVEIVLEK